MKISVIFLLSTTLLLLQCSTASYGQISYKKMRSSYSLIPTFGIPGDQKTKENFENYFSIGLRKEFSLGKFISLNAVTDYNWSQGNLSNPNLKTFNLGGGVTFYPRYLVYLILGQTYDEEVALKDHIYFDESISTNLNNSGFGSAGKVTNVRFEININQYFLSEKLSLSPKIGINASVFNGDFPQFNNSTAGFFYLGLALDLGSFKKKE